MRLDHFGALAPFYERFIPPRVSEQLIALLEMPPAATLLDAGGGTGRIAQFLAEGSAQVLVVDESMEMLQQAGKKDGLRPVCSHAERMPFADGSFDRIIMIDAFHHMADQHAAARELWRLVRPGGRIVIEEPDVRTLAVKLIALGEKLALMRTHFVAPPQIASIFGDPAACVRVERDAATAWVIVDKTGATA
jgi:demethylmenaquinone methyltransferase/2-methoxy-6-polyprenyl-1,4-benzoquinol methylase